MVPQGNVNNQANAQHKVTELDDKKKRASEVLKRVDQLIKSTELDKALLETKSAEEIDPQNVYAVALEERIKVLLAERLQAQRQKELIKRLPSLEPEGQKDYPDHKLQQSPAAVLQIVHHIAPPAATIALQSEQRVQPKTTPKPEDHQHQVVSPPVPDLKKIGTVNQTKRKPKVVMIDDDKDLLSVLSMSIESDGFEVISLNTSDEAYMLLRKLTPDIILCDINLETSTMGGFTFFEKVQEIDHLKRVPFIFLSGLNDDVLVRMGKEMGADDYLTKPIKEQNLLAALRGKLKRFEQLREMPTTYYHHSNATLPLGQSY
jgi:CheY-like chemotaxis protein